MARMLEHLGKAASAWVEPRERGETQDGPMSYADVVSTLSKVGEYWLTDPGRALEAQTTLLAGFMGIWSNSIRHASGLDPEDPRPPPRRTSDSPMRNGPATSSSAS